MTKKPLLKTAIMSVLAACGAFALTPDLLLIQCSAWLGDYVPSEAFKPALAELQQGGLVSKRSCGPDRAERYFLSEQKKAIAA